MALLVSKLRAAAWLGVAPCTLSNYLRAGKISPSRLVGHDQHAKIDINGAVRDLRKTLDQTGAQALNVKANLRFYRRSSATTGLSKEEEAQCVAQIAAEIEREEGMSRLGPE